MHFTLFASSKGLGVDLEAERTPPLLAICSIATGTPCSILKTLSGALLGHACIGTVFGLIVQWSGPWPQWDIWLQRIAWSMLVRSGGLLWRRFILAFMGWPWQLAALIDDRLNEATKSDVAHRFATVDACCLDTHFGRKLRDTLQEGAIAHYGPFLQLA